MPSLKIHDILSEKKYTTKDKVLYAISNFPHGVTTADLGKYLIKNGFSNRTVLKNLTQHLNSYKGFIVKIDNKDWRSTQKGSDFLKEKFKLTSLEESTEIIKFKEHLKKVKNPQILSFLVETVKCVEGNLFRAAVVLSWVGAVSILYDYVYKNKLKEYNLAGATRFQKNWVDVKSEHDFTNIKEANFLQLAYDIAVIDKNTKPELDSCLKRRNSCGHPNGLKIGPKTVEAHLEILILNVFEKFII